MLTGPRISALDRGQKGPPTSTAGTLGMKRAGHGRIFQTHSRGTESAPIGLRAEVIARRSPSHLDHPVHQRPELGRHAVLAVAEVVVLAGDVD